MEQNTIQKTNDLVILVIAHPDDESMFFVPTIVNLVQAGVPVWIMCLTTGDYDGLGRMRTKELQTVAGTNILNCQKVIILDNLQDHPANRWKPYDVASEIDQSLRDHLRGAHYQHINLITFDQFGVSGHVNHIDTYFGVLMYCQQRKTTQTGLAVSMWTLDSERNVIKKYVPVLEWIILFLRLLFPWKARQLPLEGGKDSHIFRLSRPWLNWKAMATHKSQFVWYRRLFVVFSCYTYANKLCRVAFHEDKAKKTRKKE